MKDKSTKILKWIKEYLSWVVAVVGLILSAIGMAKESVFATSVVYLIIIMNSLILIALGAYAVLLHLVNKAKIEQKDNQIEKEKHNVEKLEIQCNEHRKTQRYTNSNWNSVLGTLQVFINRLYNLTVESLDGTDAIKQEEHDMLIHGYKMPEVQEKTVKMAKEKDAKIAKDLYDDYKRFLRDVLSKTQDNVERYLKLNGYDLEVSVTIKQLIEPDLLSNQNEYTSKACVYTAFRDSKTWTKRIRKEVAQKLYTINKNADFVHCLSKEYYIFNNKKRNSLDYSNENAEFDKYYNCGATTLICSPKGNLDRKLYGFLACDVLNLTYQGDEIIDEEVATILGTAAFAIGIYFDNIDYSWIFCQIADTYDSFWEMIFNCYVNKLIGSHE